MDPFEMLQVSMVEDDKPIELTNDEPVEMIEEPPTLEELASCIQFPLPVENEPTEQYPSTIITEEEFAFYQQTFADINEIKQKKLHCTSCNIHMGTAPAAQQHRYEHPLLKVLMCEQCLKFYSSGDFQKDDDGSELYCRWCGQGGQVFCCAKCPFVFCKKCIQRNIGRAMVNHINNSDDWVCYACNPKDIWTLRALNWAVQVYADLKMNSDPALRTPEDNAEILTDFSTCCKNTPAKPPAKVERSRPPKPSPRTSSPRTVSPRRNSSSRFSTSSKVSISSMSPRTISPAMPVLERQTSTPPPIYPKIPNIPFRADNISEWDVLPPTKCPKKPEQGLSHNMILVPIVKKLTTNPVSGKRSGVYRRKPNIPATLPRKEPFKKRIESLLKPINISTDFEDLIDKSGNVTCTPDIISIEDSPPPSPKPVPKKPEVPKKPQRFLQVKPASKLYEPVRNPQPDNIYKTIHCPPQVLNQQVNMQTLQSNPVVTDMIQNLQKQIKPGDPQKIIKIVSPDGRAFLIDPMKMPNSDPPQIPQHYMNQARPLKKPSQPPPLQIIRAPVIAQPVPPVPPPPVVAAPKWFDNSVAGLQKISQLISSIILSIVNDQKVVAKTNRVYVYNNLQGHLKNLSDSVDKLKIDVRDEYLKSVSTQPGGRRKQPVQAKPPQQRRPQKGPSDFGNHFLTFQSEFQNKLLEKELQNQQTTFVATPKPKRTNRVTPSNKGPDKSKPNDDNLGFQIVGVQSLTMDLPQISEVTTLNKSASAMNGGEETNGMDDDYYIDPSFMMEANMEEGDQSVQSNQEQMAITITSVRSQRDELDTPAASGTVTNGVVGKQNEDSTEASKSRIKNLKKHLKEIQKEIADRRKDKPKQKEKEKPVEGEDIFQMDVTCDSDAESASAEVDINIDSDNDSVVSIPARPVSVYDINSDSDSDCVVINENDKDKEKTDRPESSASSRSKKRKRSDSESSDKVTKKGKSDCEETEKCEESNKSEDVSEKETDKTTDESEESKSKENEESEGSKVDDEKSSRENIVEKDDQGKCIENDNEKMDTNVAEENLSSEKNDEKVDSENSSNEKLEENTEPEKTNSENKSDVQEQDVETKTKESVQNQPVTPEKPQSTAKLDSISTDDLVSIAKAIAESIIEAKSAPKEGETRKTKNQEADLEQLLSSNVVFRKGDNSSVEKPSDQASGPSFGDAFSNFLSGKNSANEEASSNKNDTDLVANSDSKDEDRTIVESTPETEDTPEGSKYENRTSIAESIPESEDTEVGKNISLNDGDRTSTVESTPETEDVQKSEKISPNDDGSVNEDTEDKLVNDAEIPIYNSSIPTNSEDAEINSDTIKVSLEESEKIRNSIQNQNQEETNRLEEKMDSSSSEESGKEQSEVKNNSSQSSDLTEQVSDVAEAVTSVVPENNEVASNV